MMFVRKMRAFAQLVGFATIAILTVYGAFVALTGAPPAWAAPDAPAAITPTLVSYQGTLRNASDEPDNGTHNLFVAIYDNADAQGTALWSETHTGVEVRDGRFSLLLGATTAVPADTFKSQARYVQLTVDGQKLWPAQRFASVPYAIAANFATSLAAADGDPIDAVTTDNSGNVTVGASGRDSSLKITGDTAPNLYLDTAGGSAEWGIRANGEVFEVWEPDFSGTPVRMSIANDGAISLPGNVGIGAATTPSTALHVQTAGSTVVRIESTADTTSNLELKSNGKTWQWSKRNSSSSDQMSLYYHDGSSWSSPIVTANTSGAVTIGSSATSEINVSSSGITVDGHKPIFFRNFTGTGHMYDNFYPHYSAATWSCGIVSFRVDGDIKEGGVGDPLMRVQAWVTAENEWAFSFDMASNDAEDWEATLMCIDNSLVEWKTAYSW